MKSIKKVFLILFGNLCVAAGVVFFVVPGGFITGGVTGLALLLEAYLHLPIAYGIAGFSILLLLVGYLFLGREFAAASALSAVSYPILVFLCELLAEVVNITTDSAVINLGCAVLLFGYGVALVMRQGASTGGLDTVAVILNKKLALPLGVGVAAFEILSMATQVFYSTAEGILGGVLLTVFYTAVMNRCIASGSARVQVMVYSRKYEEINEYIKHTLVRGSTLFSVQGGYTRENTAALLTVIGYRELPAFKAAVLKIDKYAFLTISEVSEVNGNGFTHELDLPIYKEGMIDN